ncbi:MAG: T9SS type A sorting domain-containing protein [Ignavibacteria bacterium]|nr:T9SS type A sorting domain-containing protein [Ignavibacteria bacterium]
MLSVYAGYLYSQDTVKIVTWNILEYTGSDTAVRNPYFRTALNGLNPDILVIQEVYTQQVVNSFLSGVLNTSGTGTFTAGTFISGPGSDNAIYFDPSKFTFIANNPIRTSQRDINEFIVRHIPTGDTLILFTVHLMPGTGSANEQIRASEIDSLRKRTNLLPSGSNFLVLGDFNLTGANEQAYIKLVQPGGIDGRFYDVLNMPGVWNNPAYAPFHTQSSRTRSFGSGATGGLDDRFDIILFSNSVYNFGDLRYVPGSLTAYGNDGNHYDDSISRPPNNAVGQSIANALHYSSDHLPVFALFKFGNIVNVTGNQNSSYDFKLSQNHPNPFNPSTKIQFSVFKSTNVKFTIYDVTGRVMVILVNEELKPGTYVVQWNARQDNSSSELSSGVYYYTLMAGDFVETRKMILIK